MHYLVCTYFLMIKWVLLETFVKHRHVLIQQITQINVGVNTFYVLNNVFKWLFLFLKEIIFVTLVTQNGLIGIDDRWMD